MVEDEEESDDDDSSEGFEVAEQRFEQTLNN
jgi:hypothetical protein